MKMEKIDAHRTSGYVILQPSPQEKIFGIRARLGAAFGILRHGTPPGDYLRLTVVGNLFEKVGAGGAAIEIHKDPDFRGRS